MNYSMFNFEKELLEIYNSEIQRCDDEDVLALLKMERERILYNVRYRNGEYGMYRPELEKFKSTHPNLSNRRRLSLQVIARKKFMKILAYHYNTANISTETKEKLDIKLHSLYKKVGKQINSLNKLYNRNDFGVVS